MTHYYIDKENCRVYQKCPFDTVATMGQVDYTEISQITIICKFCGTDAVTKYGFKNGVQQYWCKQCERKFVDNNALPSMRYPPEQIASALGTYYEGLSLNAIRRRVNEEHGVLPSDATIYEWVVRFTQQAVDALNGIQVNAGDTWVIDETVLRLDNRNAWFWDILGDESRFLIASNLTISRNMQDAINVLTQGKLRSLSAPRLILSDGLRAYPEAIERVFGADSKHIRTSPFSTGLSTSPIERFHGTLKQRTKVMRGMQNVDTARLVLDGWLINYNFFRPHEGLGNRTPAEAADVN